MILVSGPKNPGYVPLVVLNPCVGEELLGQLLATPLGPKSPMSVAVPELIAPGQY